MQELSIYFKDFNNIILPFFPKILTYNVLPFVFLYRNYSSHYIIIKIPNLRFLKAYSHISCVGLTHDFHSLQSIFHHMLYIKCNYIYISQNCILILFSKVFCNRGIILYVVSNSLKSSYPFQVHFSIFQHIYIILPHEILHYILNTFNFHIYT